jgi:hypothetical protein
LLFKVMQLMTKSQWRSSGQDRDPKFNETAPETLKLAEAFWNAPAYGVRPINGHVGSDLD